MQVVRWWIRSKIAPPNLDVPPGAEKEVMHIDLQGDDTVVLRLIYGIPTQNELNRAVTELHIGNHIHNQMFPDDPYKAEMFIEYENTLFKVHHSEANSVANKTTVQSDLAALTQIQFNQCAADGASDAASDAASVRSFSIYSDASSSWSSNCSSEQSKGLPTLIKVPRLYPLKHMYKSGGPSTNEPIEKHMYKSGDPSTNEPIETTVYIDNVGDLKKEHWDALSTNLETMHSLGFVHTDIKLANIMWDRDKKRLVLIDFGLAFSKEIGTPGKINDTFVGTKGNWFPFDSLSMDGKKLDIEELNGMDKNVKIELLKHYDRRCLEIVRRGYQHQATKWYPDEYVGATAMEWQVLLAKWQKQEGSSYDVMPLSPLSPIELPSGLQLTVLQ
jgi:serine/threonine protein kinase